MTKKDEKTLSERAVEAQANKTDLASELGLTKDEIKTVTDFSNLIQSRVDAAPVDPLLSAVELHIQQKFPNNAEAKNEIDQTQIDDDALRYVENSCLGYPSSNLSKPAPIHKAKEDVIRASHRILASPNDANREVSYAKAMRWLTQMQVQQQYKDALGPIFEALHRIHRGYKFNAPDRTQEAVETDETLKILMG